MDGFCFKFCFRLKFVIFFLSSSRMTAGSFQLQTAFRFLFSAFYVVLRMWKLLSLHVEAEKRNLRAVCDWNDPAVILLDDRKKLTNLNLKQNLKQNPSTVHLTFYTKVGGGVNINKYQFWWFCAFWRPFWTPGKMSNPQKNHSSHRWRGLRLQILCPYWP